MFETEFNFFLAHQDELVAQYQGKTLLIRGEKIEGAFDTALEAYLTGQKTFAAGTFMVQLCVPGPDAYTVSID